MSPFIYKLRRVRCPFCRQIVITAYHELEEVAERPPKLPKNRVIAAERGELATVSNLCPHVAFFCYWGYTEPEILPAYRKLFSEMAKKLDLDDTALEGEIAVYFTDSDEADLVEALKGIIPTIKIKTVNVCLAVESRPQWNQPGILQIIFVKVPAL